MLLGKVFEKSQVMPADLLRRWMIGNAKDEIASALTALQNQAANMIMGNAQQIESQIKFGFGEILANELQPLEMALQQPKSDSNTQQLLDWFTQVQRLEQQISTIH
jgi:hypothetical protein